MTVSMRGTPVSGIFLERPNRFQAVVELEGEREIVHVPNTGRMDEMLFPGTPVLLEKSENPKRKHPYSLKFVNKNGHWICIHSALANRVFEDAVRSGEIDWAEGELKREVTFGGSRVDFRVEGKPPTLVEVKCVTYEEDGVAMFPDAPTVRGQKHVDELIRAVEEGYRAAIVFVAFMDFVHRFTPHDKIDPVLGEKLRFARDRGVLLKAYACRLGWEEIRLDRELPIHL
ncbi:sugar fermentation stimulation protein A [Melghirimyces profundicolus]|uniref:Sugar fermentation stimulation protein homolog n=1 Tax=Melghirimyces profundicolus TaxID=1242148 RepID=A0A2T6BSU5_9BACL|nr:DNA/RNA nuclease SfsA [Melghirimyces profundicolus]PTX59109.1 sugar fermentation stimulation protein A [Melghirimyces profundicolus]